LFTSRATEGVAELKAHLQKVFITGAAGFIGSSLADLLLAQGRDVVGWDNFSTGQEKFLIGANQNSRFRLQRGDNLDLEALTAAMKGCDTVFHLAANADVRFGLQHPRKDLEQNTVATFNVLEAMRSNGIKTIAFSSTGSVYGEAAVIPTPEDAPFPIQTSLYAASKLAGEGLIHSYCEGYGFEGYVFRFVSILGERYTHGHVFDFYQQLTEHPDYLKVLGDGTQRKSYLYVQDCLGAMLHVMARATARQAKHRVEVYNLGTDHFVQVNDSIRYICSALGLKPRLEYTGGERGWVGDNPFIFLDTKKIRGTGWKPALTIEEGIGRTLKWLQSNHWVYESRK
jgi:UDP-glucose 4-epimerase